jgi:hypothetical protein
MSVHGTSPTILACALLLCGCASPRGAPIVSVGAPHSQQEKEILDLRGEVTERPSDLAAQFALGVDMERNGMLEGAANQYSIVAQGLPQGKFTRPWLCLARVELALGYDVTGERALKEVLAVHPADKAGYVENDDYQEAAVLLAGILETQHADAELARSA